MSVAALHRHHDPSWNHTMHGSAMKSWLPAVILAALSHAAVGFAYTLWQAGQSQSQPLPSVQISLITIPAPQQTAPTPHVRRTPSAPATKQPAVPAAKPMAQPPVATANTVSKEPVATPENTESTPDEAQQEFSQPLYSAAYLNNPPPVYPLAARRRGIEGTVVVRARILEDGNCHEANLSKSSGHEMLDKAAVAAVRSWRFIPAKRGAQTISAWVEVPITFRLTRQDEPA